MPPDELIYFSIILQDFDNEFVLRKNFSLERILELTVHAKNLNSLIIKQFKTNLVKITIFFNT